MVIDRADSLVVAAAQASDALGACDRAPVTPLCLEGGPMTANSNTEARARRAPRSTDDTTTVPTRDELRGLLDAVTHVRADTTAKSTAPVYDVRSYVGGRFGLLTVEGPAPGSRTRALCRCRCGAACVVRIACLVSGGAGAVRACRRCRRRDGRRWAELARRRLRERANYAGLEIDAELVEDPRRLFDLIGERPSPAHSLDRADNTRGYVAGNLRWATAAEQNRNRRNTIYAEIDGQRVPAIELCERHGVAPSTFRGRVRRGWPVLAAATTTAKRTTRKLEAA